MQAQLEIARLTTYQAEALLNRALREPTRAQQHEKARAAETEFVAAAKAIDEAGKAILAVAGSYKSPDAKEEKRVRAELETSYWNARLDRAANLVDQARTYVDVSKTDILGARTKKIVEAREAFKEVVLATGAPLGIQYQAMAWLAKCYIETDDPDSARKYIDRVMIAKEKSAEAGQRLALYFDIQWIPTNVKLKISDKAKLDLAQKQALAWITRFRPFLKTREGQGVQFELAEIYWKEGNILWREAMDKAIGKEKDKAKIKEIEAKVLPPKAALDLFDKAKKYYEAVAEGDSDFAEKANQQVVSITFQRTGESTPVAALKDFNDCFLRAQFELMKMRLAAEKGERDPPKRAAHEKERKERLGQAVAALRRALAVADLRTPPSKVDEARFFLTTAYLVQGDAERAAVLGEYLGRLQPPSKNSAGGAGFALEAYASLLQRENTEDNRYRLRELAKFVLSDERQKLWSSDPVTGLARYQMAMAYLKDQDPEGRKLYREAIEQLEKLPKDFPGFTIAQAQLVFIALEARDQKEIDPKTKEQYKQIALAALSKMQKLPEDADGNAAALFFSAKLEEAKFLYEDAGLKLTKKEVPQAAAEFTKMGAYLDDLNAQIGKYVKGIPEDARDGLTASIGVLKKYATLGLAEVEYRKGNYKAVLSPALTKPIRDQIAKLAPDAGGKRRIKDFQVAADILGLSLRAEVQTGQIKEARDTLSLMESLAGEAGDIGAGLANVLRQMVVDLQVQVRELKAAKETAKLKETVGNFTIFLDDMATKGGVKGLSTGDVIFLAGAFASLEQYDRAAKLFEKVTPPKLLDSPAKMKFVEKEELELYSYWRIRLEYAKTLRLGKGDLKKAAEIVENLLGHEHGRLQLMAKVEKYQIYEESGLFGTAIKGWSEVMNDRFLKERLPDDTALGILFGKKAKEVYFDAYYHYGYCAYKYGQSEAGMKAGVTKKYTEFAAKHFLRLKTTGPEGWAIVEPKVTELLAAEAPLREAFERLAKAAK
ncbi:MAG: hypothetical protein U0793_12100 [Gemmataceae bacterium]